MQWSRHSTYEVVISSLDIKKDVTIDYTHEVIIHTYEVIINDAQLHACQNKLCQRREKKECILISLNMQILSAFVFFFIFIHLFVWSPSIGSPHPHPHACNCNNIFNIPFSYFHPKSSAFSFSYIYMEY